jgi:hypothetical protein
MMTYRDLILLMQCMTEAELDAKVMVYDETYDYHYPVNDFVVTEKDGGAFPIIVLE